MADLTQAQLEELVVGKAQNPNVIFYEHATLNVPKSHEHGRRMYDTKVYVKLSQPGVSDNISYLAQKEDIKKYPDEYQYFLANRGGKSEPGIEIIPNLDIAHLQELRDYGILTVAKLAGMETVPPHLEYAHKAAKVLQTAFEVMNNGKEESVEEDPRSAIEQAGFQEAGAVNGRRTLPQAGGQELIHDALRHPIPTRPEGEAREAARGDEEGRQVQHDHVVKKPVDPSRAWDNWRLEITYN
jgi:hypothetical protein